MKYVLTLFLGLFGSLVASAQKNSLYADAGICLAYLDPGSSITYNYNASRHIGLGAGVQEYNFHVSATNIRQLTSAIYGELRLNMRQRKKGRYFLFLDFGEDFYTHNTSYYRDGDLRYTVPGNDGVYGGLGFGYMRYTTERHGGPYASLKLITNWCKTDEYNTATNEQRTEEWSDGTLVLSVGFKF